MGVLHAADGETNMTNVAAPVPLKLYKVHLEITYTSELSVWADTEQEARDIVELHKQKYTVSLGDKPTAKITGVEKLT